MSIPNPVIVLPPDGGDHYQLLSNRMTIKLGTDETNGTFALIDGALAPGTGPAPHRHSREMEGFYVLDGTITFSSENGSVVARPGDFVHSPNETLHGWKNTGPTTARVLTFLFPAGFEGYFAEAGDPVTYGKAEEIAGVAPSPEAIASLLSHLAELSPGYGLQHGQFGEATATGTTIAPMRLTSAATAESYGVMSDRMTCLATAESSGGAYSLYEATIPPMGGVPIPHRHQNEEETFYILDGEITLTLPDGSTTVATPGTLFHSPRGTMHAFQNLSDRTARMLVLITPGANMETFFRSVSGPAQTDADLALPAAPPTPEQIAFIAEAAARHGIELLTL